MREIKHTPGPWIVTGWFYPECVEGDVLAKDADNLKDATPICRVYKPRSKNWCADKKNLPIDAFTSLGQKIPERKVIEANARLIAAAPDLLEALHIFAGPPETSDAETDVPNDSRVTIRCELGDLRRAHAAIRKATGATP